MFGSTNTKLQGSGLSYGYIMAEYPKGSQCQVTRELDEKILKAKDTGGNWAFALPEVLGLKLPKEYQEVEYLRSDGNQFIDLDFKPSGATEFEIDFRIENASFGTSNPRTIFGARTEYDSNVFQLSTYVESSFSSYAGDFAYGTSGTIQQMAHDAGIVINSRMQISFHNYIYETSTGKNYNISPATINPNSTMLLFGLHSNGTTSEKMYGNIYSVKFWSDSNTIIRELYPCYRKIDSVAGMYDIVSNTFFTNAGTGTFAVGPDAGGDKWTAYCTDGENEAENRINILYNGDIKSTKLYYRVPKEYQAIEYLQNSTNAYYDTGIIPITTNYTTEVKFQIAQTNGGYLLGVEGGYFIRKPDGYNQLYYGYDNASAYFSADGLSTIGTDFDLIYNATGGQIILNGVVKATNNNIKALSDRQYSILIGANRYGRSVDRFYGTWRYKEIIISERDTGNKLAELFPCYRKSDNVVGFWDTVGQKFLTHLGTGTVTAGPDI